MSWIHQHYITILESKNKDLERNQEFLELCASLLRHDLSNDLSKIKYCLSEIEQEIPTQHLPNQLLQISIRASERMSTLVKVLSTPSLVTELNIITLLEKQARQAEAIHNNLTVKIISKLISHTHYSSTALLPMVFGNLFRNAAIHAGSSPTVTVTVSKEEETLQIIVEDNGLGIPDQIKNHVLKRKVMSEHGSGMGLYLTMKIIGLHRGSITLLEDEHQTGCAFLITLPCETL